MTVDLKKIEDLIIKELQIELLSQGHDASGSLYNSLNGGNSIELPDKLVIEILMNDYGVYVNDGRKSGGKKVPITALLDWIERKAIAQGDKEKKSIAFAIQQQIFKEGSPTSGSFSFSKNGRRIGFIDFVVENRLGNVFDELSEEVFKKYDAIIADLVNDFNKKNK